MNLSDKEQLVNAIFGSNHHLFWEPNKTKTYIGGKPEFLNVKASGTYGYHCAKIIKYKFLFGISQESL